MKLVSMEYFVTKSPTRTESCDVEPRSMAVTLLEVGVGHLVPTPPYGRLV